jgi:hypothetical protein
LKLKECMNLISGVRCISLAGGCTKGWNGEPLVWLCTRQIIA